MGSVLVGVDHTNEGQAAVREGIAEAARRQTDVLFFHYVRVGVDEHELPRRKEGEHLLQEAEADAKEAGVISSSRLEMGVSTAANQVLDLAAEENVDAIVIGTRRRSRVGKLLMGSDAQQIILGASCPVVCVKAAGGAEQVQPQREEDVEGSVGRDHP
jgi:nucleotide-binding universal stress UspA family protein